MHPHVLNTSPLIFTLILTSPAFGGSTLTSSMDRRAFAVQTIAARHVMTYAHKSQVVRCLTANELVVKFTSTTLNSHPAYLLLR